MSKPIPRLHIRTLMVFVVIAGVMIALAVQIAAGNQAIITAIACVVLLAPLWLTAVIGFMPPFMARRMFHLACLSSLSVFAYWMYRGVGKGPWPYLTAFVCMGLFWLTPAFGIGYALAKARHTEDSRKDLDDQLYGSGCADHR